MIDSELLKRRAGEAVSRSMANQDRVRRAYDEEELRRSRIVLEAAAILDVKENAVTQIRHSVRMAQGFKAVTTSDSRIGIRTKEQKHAVRKLAQSLLRV